VSSLASQALPREQACHLFPTQGRLLSHLASAAISQRVGYSQRVRPALGLKVQRPLIAEGLVILGERLLEVLQLRIDGWTHNLSLKRCCWESAGR